MGAATAFCECVCPVGPESLVVGFPQINGSQVGSFAVGEEREVNVYSSMVVSHLVGWGNGVCVGWAGGMVCVCRVG